MPLSIADKVMENLLSRDRSQKVAKARSMAHLRQIKRSTTITERFTYLNTKSYILQKRG